MAKKETSSKVTKKIFVKKTANVFMGMKAFLQIYHNNLIMIFVYLIPLSSSKSIFYSL